ncbi:ComF family protein [Comamonas sp. NLF-1-9]|uniref:ComF family protein n=1 Tax=Comamonas sp. NLF-1-9 TaxID=2853163 RepID=UPI001C48EA42|nr:ComF family protein [Comamonas sp. NLF-1-9]QXL84733.1 ComF family protein [Comamonas sp. NLF-1-9]
MLFTRLLGTSLAWAGRLPSRCVVCHAWPAQRICSGCASALAQPRRRCPRCALPLPDGVQVCGHCLREPSGLDACVAVVDYGWPWSGLVTQLKFHGAPGVALALAELMRSRPDAREMLGACDALVPLPLAPQRLRERGYNQAQLLARALARGKLQVHWLARSRDTTAQTELDRRARLRNLQGAFRLTPAALARLPGQRVLLVDDVMTTGASLHAAADVLRAGGALSVGALVFARTP